MNFYVILLRLLHIFGGVFWVGAAGTHILFIEPAARATKPESGRFMQALMVRQRLPISISISSWITIISGLLLYWRGSSGFQISWITSSMGLAFTISALAAFLSFFIGMLVLGPTAKKMGAISQGIGPGGPTDEQRRSLGDLEARMHSAGKVDLVFLVIALLGMAVARYFWI
jgi:uncharacterized membrane protein